MVSQKEGPSPTTSPRVFAYAGELWQWKSSSKDAAMWPMVTSLLRLFIRALSLVAAEAPTARSARAPNFMVEEEERGLGR